PARPLGALLVHVGGERLHARLPRGRRRRGLPARRRRRVGNPARRPPAPEGVLRAQLRAEQPARLGRDPARGHPVPAAGILSGTLAPELAAPAPSQRFCELSAGLVRAAATRETALSSDAPPEPRGAHV